MKNKKIILQLICCAAAVTAFTVPVHAQITEKSCATKGQVVVFEGAADSAESLITYQVSEGNGGVFGGKELYYIGEKTTDENGGFKIEFSLEESGDYVLRMKDSAGDILDKPIKYLDEEDNGKILMEEINSGDDARIKKAIAAFDFSFDGKKYEELKTAAVENWLTECAKKKLPYADSTAFKKDFDINMSLYYVNHSNTAAIAQACGKYAALMGLSGDSDVSKFVSGATDSQKSALVKQLSSKPAQSPQMLASAIAEALKVTGNQGGGSGGSGGSSGGGSSKGSSANKGTGFVGVGAPYTKNDASGNTKAEGFVDLNNAEWAREAIEALASRGVVSGDGNGHFRPNDPVTREEFVKMILSAADIPTDDTRTAFLDVFESDWFYTYISGACKAGIITGISEEMFGVHLKITRQDAAVVLVRTADYSGRTLEEKRNYTGFADESEIADYAAEAVKRLYQGGIVNGMDGGSFKPRNTCTRAEAAKMIYGLL